MYEVISSANSDSFTSFFPICIPLGFFLASLLWLGLPLQCEIISAFVGVCAQSLSYVPLFETPWTAACKSM